jgi:hypothetical protein
MHSSVLSLLLLAATATLGLASPSSSSSRSVSRRNGPLSKQRLHNRAHSLKRSSPSSASAPSTRRRTRSRRSPMAESLEERNMLERDQIHQEDKRGLLDGVLGSTTGSSSSTSSPVGNFPSVPGSSVLGLVKLQNLLNSGSSGMTTHQANIGKPRCPFYSLLQHPPGCPLPRSRPPNRPNSREKLTHCNLV